jgi:hypothetical protein
MLVQGMIERTQQDGKLAWNCLGRLHAVLEKEFDLKHKFKLKKEYEIDYGAAAVLPAKSQANYHHYKG